MNPHTLAGTSSLGWRVCQFRHSDEAPGRPGSAANLPARPLLPARWHRPAGGHPPSMFHDHHMSGIQSERRDSTTLITFDNPEAFNALMLRMINDLVIVLP